MAVAVLKHAMRVGFAAILVFHASVCLAQQDGLLFEVSVAPSLQSGAIDGRMLLLLSTRDDDEPRFHVVNRRTPQPFFGVDVDGLAPGQAAVFDETVLGYPLQSLREIPAGEYYVQALLNRYQTFHRADGHVVKLHMDQWEGQKWNRSPGNLYSVPEKIAIDPVRPETYRIELPATSLRQDDGQNR